MEKNLPRTVKWEQMRVPDWVQRFPAGVQLEGLSVFHDPFMTLLPDIPKALHAALLEEQTHVEHPETFPGVPQRLGREKHLTGSLGEAQEHLTQCGERSLFQKTPRSTGLPAPAQ